MTQFPWLQKVQDFAKKSIEECQPQKELKEELTRHRHIFVDRRKLYPENAFSDELLVQDLRKVKNLYLQTFAEVFENLILKKMVYKDIKEQADLAHEATCEIIRTNLWKER